MNDIDSLIATIFTQPYHYIIPNSITLDILNKDKLSEFYSVVLTIGITVANERYGYFNHAKEDGKINISLLDEKDLEIVNTYFSAISVQIYVRKREVYDKENHIIYDDGLDEYYPDDLPQFTIFETEIVFDEEEDEECETIVAYTFYFSSTN